MSREELFNEIRDKFQRNFESIKSYNTSGIIRKEIDGHKFSLLFSRSEIVVWAYNGNLTIGEVKYDYEKGFNEEQFSPIYEAITNFLSGFIHCSDCGKLIKREEVAGHFYAGSYCKDCWEGKWKAIEARENYD